MLANTFGPRTKLHLIQERVVIKVAASLMRLQLRAFNSVYFGQPAHVALLSTVTVLAAGATSALAAVFVPAYARLFLRPALRDLEVRHYAQSLFLRRELFKTQARNGILILVCMFERKVEILPDVGLYGKVASEDWERVVAAMAPLLRHGRFADALHAGLAMLGKVLAAKGFAGRLGRENELPDGSIEEQGPS